jgi:NAD-dependent dihydropyrimidine dehydrogenase PreA subunit
MQRVLDVCPTGPLNVETNGDEVSLAFDPSLCTACGECTRVCPKAEARELNIERRTGLAAIARGRTLLHRDVERRCEGCGAAIASAGMLRKLTSRL